MSFCECSFKVRRVGLLFGNVVCMYAGLRYMPVFRIYYVGNGFE